MRGDWAMSDRYLRERTAKEVLSDHIKLRERGEFGDDLARNYAPDVVVLTSRESSHGRRAIRQAAALLGDTVAHVSFRFHSLVVGDRMGFAEWVAEGRDESIQDGVDSYLIEDGWIKAQTTRYTIISSEGSGASLGESKRTDARQH
jgi:hypothetical protein